MNVFKKASIFTFVATIAAFPAGVAYATANEVPDNTVAAVPERTETLDTTKTGSLTIYRYDTASAESANIYTDDEFPVMGESDTNFETAMTDYAIEGAQFTYLKVGGVETYNYIADDIVAFETVYEIPAALAGILELTEEESYDMAADSVTVPCTNNDVYHYTYAQISDALAACLESDTTATRNSLEEYLYSYAFVESETEQAAEADENESEELAATVGALDMELTDESGRTNADNLELGLYLIMETEIPEQVAETVNPWFVSLPLWIDAEADGEADDIEAEDIGANDEPYGAYWLYGVTCYPEVLRESSEEISESASPEDPSDNEADTTTSGISSNSSGSSSDSSAASTGNSNKESESGTGTTTSGTSGNTSSGSSGSSSSSNTSSGTNNSGSSSGSTSGNSSTGSSSNTSSGNSGTSNGSLSGNSPTSGSSNTSSGNSGTSSGSSSGNSPTSGSSSNSGETVTHTHKYTSTITKAATCAEDGIRTYTCSCGDSYTEVIPATGNHSWVAQTTTVHHDEVGHYETVTVQEAWDEPIYDTRPVCNACGASFTSADEVLDHIFISHDGASGYSVKKVVVGTVHHDAVTEQRWVVDQAAYDETVTTGYKCSVCGATK